MRRFKLDDAILQLVADSKITLHEISVVAVVEELVDRRAEADSDLRRLEQSLAFDNAMSTIETNCRPVEGRSDWFDIDDCSEAAELAVIPSVSYLRMRGLLEEDDDDPRNIVSIRYESEATA